jgi:hypothetical protein
LKIKDFLNFHQTKQLIKKHSCLGGIKHGKYVSKKNQVFKYSQVSINFFNLINGGFMIKNYLCVLLISALIPFEMKAEWVSVDKNATSNNPNVKILSDDISSTVIKIDISGFDVRSFIKENKTYQALDLLTEVFTTKPGYPELPYISKVLAIPDQSGISIEVLETGAVQTFKDIYLPPARSSWYEGSPESLYEENSEAYQSDEVYPKEYVQIDPPSVFRDFRITRVSFFPVRYVPAKKELQVVSSITVRINYGTGEIVNPKTTSKKRISPSFGKLYRSHIYNYQNVLDKLYNGKEEGQEVILCIMPDEFVASFQIYADWKRQSGTNVHITKFSDIGANSSNPDIIKNHISDAYSNWVNPPTYVLIVGDDGVFPKKIVTYPDYSFPNEDYFVEVEGNDYFPEMMIGRFTNQGDYRMQVMINKFLLYEKNPYTANTDWFKKGVCCSNNYYASQVETKRFTAGVMLDDGGFTSVDTLMSDGNGWGYGCTVDLNDVLSTLNNGRGFLNYRGEGWSDGWHASCYDFSTSDVSGLNNGEKFTFVTSIGCGVAMFDTYGGNSFGEEWIEMGSLTAPKGASAFIGPTSNTHTTYNNRIDKGIYMGMFQEGMDTPGQALLRGKLFMYEVFGNEYYVEYHYKIYCVLGDPSIHIWKDVPLAVNVNHPTSVPVGTDQIEFTITFASSGQPVANAELCLTGDDIFATGVSGSDGKVYIEITPLVQETLTVTVRGGNVIPYQGTIAVIQPTQLVEPASYPLIVDIDGNTDGLINPNENCNITFTLKNWGSQTASNVQATLTTTNPNYVQIISTNPVSFGNLAPGNSFTGNPFQFFVKPDCPVGQIFTLQLHVTSTSNFWDYYYDIEVKGCELMFKNFLVYDADLPNANFRLDPGETVSLVLSIENIGEDVAPNVMGILTSNDPYITIEDSNGYFGTLGINSSATSNEDYFEVSVSASCPTQYMAEFSLNLYTQNGNYPYQTFPDFNVPVGLPIPTDYSGPDAYGYYAYASSDAFFDQSPVYNWFELIGAGTQINLPVVSDYTETINLPFTFKYYGTNYSVCRVSTDGWIAFGGGTQTAPVNTTLPNNDNVNNMVAVFWDDLYDTEFFMGKIFYHNDNANHRFIIEWDSISRNNFVAEPVREVFQVILLDPVYYNTPTGDGEIIMQYKKVEEPESCTVGIENSSQNIGLEYVFNQNYDPTASDLINGLAIKFTTKTPSVSSIITGDGDHELSKNNNPAGYSLEQNHPNPFNSDTWISYSLPEPGNVVLQIFNVGGELVRTLQNGQQPTGKYSIEWNGLNNDGNPVSSGIYFYRLQTSGFVKTMKMFMLK